MVINFQNNQNINVVVMSFTDEARAYQTLTRIKQLHGDGAIALRSATVITHQEDGDLKVQDAAATQALGGGMFTGGLIGSMVGILGGPLGVLLGWGAGSLIGAMRERDSVKDDISMMEMLGQAIPEGSTGIVAEIAEPAQDVLDTLASEMGATVVRRPIAEVQEEIDTAQNAEKVAARARQSQETQEHFQTLKSDARNAGSKLLDGLEKGLGRLREALDDDDNRVTTTMSARPASTTTAATGETLVSGTDMADASSDSNTANDKRSQDSSSGALASSTGLSDTSYENTSSNDLGTGATSDDPLVSGTDLADAANDPSNKKDTI